MRNSFNNFQGAGGGGVFLFSKNPPNRPEVKSSSVTGLKISVDVSSTSFETFRLFNVRFSYPFSVYFLGKKILIFMSNARLIVSRVVSFKNFPFPAYIQKHGVLKSLCVLL